jgi:hypothetical protein
VVWMRNEVREMRIEIENQIWSHYNPVIVTSNEGHTVSPNCKLRRYFLPQRLY